MEPVIDLNELIPEELGMLFPIIIEEHSSEWADLYQLEKNKIITSFLQDEIIIIK